jgi:hypothetical protein
MQHIVQANDNPTKLAIKYVGDSKRWPELCAANPQLAKHADWGCVFPAVGKSINLPDSWAPVDPSGGGGGSSVVPVTGEAKKVDTKVVLIGAAIVAAVVVFVYARGKKKMVANRRRRRRVRRRRS